MSIQILHLYYDIMNLYGDYGNVSILKKHLEDQGMKVEVDKKTISDEIDFEKYDFIFIGSGTERSLDRVIEDSKDRREYLENYINKGKVFLATGNSFEIFGDKIDDNPALKIFDFEVKRDKDRTTSDVIYESDYLEKRLVGFVNKQTEIYHNMNPFFKVIFGIGENENNDYEGVKYKNFYGTHVSGPVLVRNPEFLNMIVTKICETKNDRFKLNKIEYKNEEDGYNITLTELEKRLKESVDKS